MSPTPSPEQFDELRDCIEREVAAGFLAADEIVETAIEMVEDAEALDAAMLHAQAGRLTQQALHDHARAQAQWPATTDCDRLDTAFEALQARGILARQNYSCCGSCGVAEIHAEIAAAEQEPARAIAGYVFYHAQDTEAAVEGYGVCLNYGAVADGEAAALAIAREVVAVLHAHGLATQWDGTWSQRISVPLEWQRRRPATTSPLPDADTPL